MMHFNYIAAIVLMMLGLWAMIAEKNIIKKTNWNGYFSNRDYFILHFNGGENGKYNSNFK